MAPTQHPMTAEPDDTLADAMLARAGDLAHYMQLRGQSIAAASGVMPNGLPCTIVYAVGDQAEVMRDVADRVVRWVGENRDAAAARAKEN